MTGRQIALLRWVCVLPAAYLAGLLGDAFMARVVMPLWFHDLARAGLGRWWQHLIYSFLGEAGFVVVGAMVAPRFRLRTAVVLAMLSWGWDLLVHSILHGDHTPTVARFVAVLAGVAVVYFSEKPRATPTE